MKTLFILACVFHVGYQKAQIPSHIGGPKHAAEWHRPGEDYTGDIFGKLAKIAGALISDPEVQDAAATIILKLIEVITEIIAGKRNGLEHFQGLDYVGKLNDVLKGLKADLASKPSKA